MDQTAHNMESGKQLDQVKIRTITVYMAGNYHDVFVPENGTVSDVCKAAQKTADFNKYTLGGVEGGLEIQTMMLEDQCELDPDEKIDIIELGEIVLPVFNTQFKIA